MYMYVCMFVNINFDWCSDEEDNENDAQPFQQMVHIFHCSSLVILILSELFQKSQHLPPKIILHKEYDFDYDYKHKKILER